LTREMPLIGLGRPGETYGAARIATSDDEWESLFQTLSRRATLVLMIPGDTPGTVKELVWLLRNGLTSKCVFIMPETFEYSEAAYRGNWPRIRETAEGHG